MANTFVTPSIVAREALMVLFQHLVAAGLVFRDYDREFRQVGDTINVRNPATLVAKDFPTEGLVLQNVTESSVAVVLNKHKDVSVTITSKERALSLKEFRSQVVAPAMRALALQIDSDLLALYKDVPYKVGAAATTPDGLEDLANVRLALANQNVPLEDGMLSLVIDPAAEAKFLQLDSLVEADKAGQTGALRRANLGRLYGMGVYMSQNVPYHTTGGDDCAVDLVAGYAIGDTVIHCDALAGKPVEGDLFTLGAKDYVVSSATALAGADSDVTLKYGLEAAAADDAPITVTASHRANLGFHRNAFCLATAPLEPPASGIRCEVLNYQGLAIRVVYDWDRTTKADVISFDVLYGVKTLNRKMAVRLLG